MTTDLMTLGGTHLQREYVDTFDRPRYVASPSSGADAWQQGAQGAESKWATNLQNTTKDIVGNAIRSKGAMVANFNAAVNEGRWEAKLQAVGNAGIKAAAQKKSANYSTGIAGGKDAYLRAAQTLYPYIGSGQQLIEAMPSGTISASKARAAAWIDYMHAYKTNG